MNQHCYPTFSESITSVRSYLAEIEPIFNRPEFSNWGMSEGSVSGSLIQFFPQREIDSERGVLPPAFDVVESARACAKILGGKWTRGVDGAWEGTTATPSGARLKVIFHSVEAVEVREPFTP